MSTPRSSAGRNAAGGSAHGGAGRPPAPPVAPQPTFGPMPPPALIAMAMAVQQLALTPRSPRSGGRCTSGDEAEVHVDGTRGTQAQGTGAVHAACGEPQFADMHPSWQARRRLRAGQAAAITEALRRRESLNRSQRRATVASRMGASHLVFP